MVARSASGEAIWTNTTGAEYAPSIAADGSVVSIAINNYLTRLNPDGSTRSSTNMAIAYSMDTAAPVLDDEGAAYLSTTSAYSTLAAIRADGTVKWQLKSAERLVLMPVVDSDGTVFTTYSATNSDYTVGGTAPRLLPQVVAVRSDGSIRWAFTTGESPSTPVIAADGTVIVSAGKFLYALATEDGQVRWQLDSPSGAAFGTPVLDYAGILCVPTMNGLLSLQLNSGLANAPWPMHRQNPRLSACQARPALPQASIELNPSGIPQLNLQVPGGAVILSSEDLFHWERLGWQPASSQTVLWPLNATNTQNFYRILPP
jgi:hypothetical protein